MINCEIEVDLIWTRNCIISETSRTSEVAANPDGNLPVQARKETTTTSATFQINSANIYVPVVTLSIKDNTLNF